MEKSKKFNKQEKKQNTNKYITEIITLQNRDVSSGFIDRFKRILSRQSFISIFPEINSFLLVDTEQNVKKIRDLVKALDKISQSDISILSLNKEILQALSSKWEGKISRLSPLTLKDPSVCLFNYNLIIFFITKLGCLKSIK